VEKRLQEFGNKMTIEQKIKCNKCSDKAISIISVSPKKKYEKSTKEIACCLEHEKEIYEELKREYNQSNYNFYITDIST
jgi:hypothetical protein